MKGHNVMQVDAAWLQAELAPFEKRYHLTSQEFLHRWRLGEGECDSHDYSEWAGLCYLATRVGLLNSTPPVPA